MILTGCSFRRLNCSFRCHDNGKITINIFQQGLMFILRLYESLRPDKLSGRNDVTLDKVNFRSEIRKKYFFWKKSGHQEFVWLLKQFGATVP